MPRSRSRDVTCFQCGAAFDRGYAIGKERAARPQLCSPECRTAFSIAIAADRLEDRFWDRVQRGAEDACWPWKGRVNARGYGLFDMGNRPEIASRVAYEIHTGCDVGNLFVLHECDNPPCCNPRHLRQGTHQDNMADMARRGRAHVTGWRGDRHPSSKLTSADVRAIRASEASNREMADTYGVTTAAIYNIRHRKTWRDEP